MHFTHKEAETKESHLLSVSREVTSLWVQGIKGLPLEEGIGLRMYNIIKGLVADFEIADH